jgi:hypothetical protein
MLALIIDQFVNSIVFDMSACGDDQAARVA